MVGATAFMETIELAIELAGRIRERGERPARPLPLHRGRRFRGETVGAPVRLIDRVAAQIDGEALREAQAAKDAVRAYELVAAALGE